MRTEQEIRVKTVDGEGVLTGKADLTRNGKDWLRKAVKLDKHPNIEIWYFKNEIEVIE
jgi:hypothetical protein